ncbi:hypothetical protein CTI14_27225, partial [Methylobacterium radiotolerans]
SVRWRWQPFGAGIGFVLYGTYPITVWLALVLGGMALGRLRVQEVRTAVVALIVGVVLAAIGYGLGALGSGAGLGGTESIVSSTSASSGSESIEILPDESLSSSFIPDDVMPPSGWESYPEALAATDPLGSMVARSSPSTRTAAAPPRSWAPAGSPSR